MATGDAQRFVNRGVIVQIVVDAVAPHVAPAIGAEQPLDGLFGMIVVDIDRALVDHKRHRVVGNQPIVREDDGERFEIFADNRHDVLS